MATRTNQFAPNGCLVLVTGPSGAGKDSIMSHAARILHNDQRFCFPKRIVTRAASNDEDHLSISRDEFVEALSKGAFALAWDAHGLSYAIPASVDADLGIGRMVVCNVSRAIVNVARQRFGRAFCIEITAPIDILRQRLIGRGRETPEDVEQRLVRQVTSGQNYSADQIIDNNTSIDTAVAAFVSVLLRLAAS